MRIYMTAAHGGYNSECVPLGGGAAVCERLCRAWAGKVELHLLAPGPHPPPGTVYHRLDLLGDRVPSQLNELDYARFCRRFEAEATRLLLEEARDAVVFSHDISEGPDFRTLARERVPCVPIFHVDVVDFFNRMYLKNLFPVHIVARAFRRVEPWAPDLLKLVFTKQAQAVESCPRLVVPSPMMKNVLERCYPGLAPERTLVIGWGAPDRPGREISPNGSPGKTLLTLSRLSPEKGQDRLLEALKIGEERGESLGLTYVCCGSPAFMQGRAFERRLKRLAQRLTHTRVVFPGHLGGMEKDDAFRRADLFVVPSRHESYGLTTMEAMSAGTPVVAVRSYGTEATVAPDRGRLVEPGPQLSLRLWLAIRDLLDNPQRLEELSGKALQFAQRHTFREAADSLLDVARELTPR